MREREREREIVSDWEIFLSLKRRIRRIMASPIEQASKVFVLNTFYIKSQFHWISMCFPRRPIFKLLKYIYLLFIFKFNNNFSKKEKLN